MFKRLRSTALCVVVLTAAACADGGRDPTAPVPAGGPDLLTLSADPNTTVMRIEDLDASFGVDGYSLDVTPEGLSAPWYQEVELFDGETAFCRDHFSTANLYWDPGFGHGSVVFRLPPPLLFRSYRRGTIREKAGILRLAVYETIVAVEGSDQIGNTWRFRGRFNAKCRGGAVELGPIVFGAQAVVPENPIDIPVLIRSGNYGGGGCEEEFQLVYNPYDSGSRGDDCGPRGEGDGSGGGGGETGTGGSGSCRTEYVYVEVSLDGGNTWTVWWEGEATVCE